MVRIRQAPFPSYIYCTVLQLSHALGEKNLPLVFSSGRRAVLSLPPSSPCKGMHDCGAAPRCGRDEPGCSKKCSQLLLDPVSAEARARGSGSADAKWGQAVRCSCWNDCSAGGGRKLLQLGLKSEQSKLRFALKVSTWQGLRTGHISKGWVKVTTER